MFATPVPRCGVDFNRPPWRLSGTVYGALLNHAPQLVALGDAMHQPPHKAPPRAPVLEVKPRHMLAPADAVLHVPAGAAGLEISASVGLVIGRVACCVKPAAALDHVAGALLVGEVSLPLVNHYRPGARLKARDGFCPLGERVVPLRDLPVLDALQGRGEIDGHAVHVFNTADRVRNAAQLIADVTEFMTLQPGDVLTLGVSHGAPVVQAGRSVRVSIDGLGELRLRVEPELQA